jgi:peptidase M28-like protein
VSTEANWLGERLEELERIERPSASEGERQAAEWLVAQFAELGTQARIEADSAHGTYWWSLGLGAALGTLGAVLALRGRRLLGALLGIAGAAGIADDFPPNQRRLRRLLPQRTTYNVVCELPANPRKPSPKRGFRGLADPCSERTIVFIAHHDAPHSGLVFHPRPAQIADKLGLIEKTNTSPPLMAPVIGGPLLAALGAITGRRGLAKLGALFGLGTVAAMADVGLRPVVPGANDNGAACVVLLALAKRFAEEPPEGARVILLSTGSEESFSEGMKAWGERHFPELSKEGTLFLCLEALGSDHLLVLRGEGFLKMNEYSPRALAFMDDLAAKMGVWLYPNLRIRNGTDGLEPLAAGYETAVLCSCNDLKQASNYHWPTDVAANINYATLERSISLCQEAVRRLSRQWL